MRRKVKCCTVFRILNGNFLLGSEYTVLRIRIRIFLGLPDPDPLVQGTDKDPDTVFDGPIIKKFK
jgi:hypothetical protein